MEVVSQTTVIARQHLSGRPDSGRHLVMSCNPVYHYRPIVLLSHRCTDHEVTPDPEGSRG